MRNFFIEIVFILRVFARNPLQAIQIGLAFKMSDSIENEYAISWGIGMSISSFGFLYPLRISLNMAVIPKDVIIGNCRSLVGRLEAAVQRPAQILRTNTKSGKYFSVTSR